jgi:capsular polysaccharide biosynthesis protein
VNDDQVSLPGARPSDVTILTAVSRHRWLVAAVAVVVAAIGGIAASNTTASYTSSAGLVLQDPTTKLLAGTGTGTAAAGDERRYIASQVPIIKSQSVADAASKILASLSDPINLSSDDIRGATSVSSDAESNFVVVSVKAATRREAQADVDAVVAGYRSQVIANQTATLADAIARVDKRIDSAYADFNANLQNDEVAVARNKRITELSEELSALSTSGLSPTEVTDRAESIDAELQAWLHVGQARREEPNATAQQNAAEQILALIQDLRSQRNSLESRSASVGDGVVLSSSAAKAVENGISTRTAVLISLFLGLVLGSGLAYWSDSRRRSVVDRRQPSRHLGIRILAEVPEFGPTRLGEPIGLLTSRTDRAESFQFLANDLETAGRLHQERGWTLAFVAIRSRDGASMIAANVARWAAIQGRRVVAVDADAHAAMSTALSATDGHQVTTLADLLSGGPSSRLRDLRPTETFPGGGSLTVVAPGRQEGDSFGLFQPDRLAVLFDHLEDVYDVVVVDVPPLLDVAGGSAFLTAADSVVVVVRHKTNVNDLDLARARLDLLGVTPVGYVYNHVPATARAKEPVRAAE